MNYLSQNYLSGSRVSIKREGGLEGLGRMHGMEKNKRLQNKTSLLNRCAFTIRWPRCIRLNAGNIYLFVLVLTLPFLASAQKASYDTVSLNGTWKFRIDPNNAGNEAAWYQPLLNDSGWDSISVPGNWDLRNEYAHYAGKAWFRKTFTLPAQWQHRVVRLLFEGVNNDSKVWLNGKLLGSNNLGFLPFAFNISSTLNKSSTNTLVVCADNTFKRGALWNWGGIRRPVMAIASPTVYIDSLFITPVVNLAEKAAEVSIRVNVQNTTARAAHVSATLVLTGPQNFFRTLTVSGKAAANEAAQMIVSTVISDADMHLWDFDHPHLYHCQVIVQNNRGETHQASSRFGLRKVEVDKESYAFKLNGTPVRIMGFNLVPDDRTTGNTLPLWRVKEDIDLLKAFGANLARLSHLPMHREMLDYLDEKGILVFEEIPLWGFDPLVNKSRKEPFEWLHRLIAADYNHPSIIGWGVGNEIGFVPTVMEYVDTAIQVVKNIDPSRLAVMVNHTADRGREDPIRFSDVGLINKYGTAIGSLADTIHSLHPQHVLFYTEFGYGQTSENLDTDINAKAMLDSLRFKPYLVGGALWTFNDYRSNYVGTKELSGNRAWGIVDVFRQKKKAYHSFRKEFAPVREMNIRFQQNDSSYIASVQLVPRKPLDLPAYELKDYILAVKGYRADGNIITGDFRALPLIRPGDQPVGIELSLHKKEELTAIEVVLLTPQHYAVYDSTLFLNAPEPPVVRSIRGFRTEMNDIRPNTGTIQVVLEKPAPRVTTIVAYKKNGQTKFTAPTRNSFIEIPNLPFNEVYEVSVKSVNAFGESAFTTPQKVKVEMEAGAPLVYYVEPANGGFFIGYKTLPEDYAYVVQYTTTPGDYIHAKAIQSSTKGVLFIPNLLNGQRYFFRLKTIKQNNAHSAWSNEYKVLPDGHQLPDPPFVQGVLRNGSNALLCFEPVKKSTGYTIEYKPVEAKKWQPVEVTAAQINQFVLTGLEPDKQYQFRMQSRNANGHSGWTKEIHQ